jgi:23S rRNA pseudouridine2605 synthase
MNAVKSKTSESGERLQKVLAQLGLASRRQAEEWIKAGRVSVNAETAQLGQRVRPEDQLRLDGRPIRQRPASKAVVLLCHRSPGVPLLPRTARPLAGDSEAAAEEPAADATEALSLSLPRSAGRRFISISPMPQVDGGLELLSADGALAAQLQRAVHEHPSEFSVRIRGELSDEQRAAVLEGMLDRGVPLRVQSIEPAGGEGVSRWYQLIAQGASGNQIRQLLERCGVLVSRVLRTRLGPLQLERTLPRGRWRELTEEEQASLLRPPSPPAAAEADSSGSGPTRPARGTRGARGRG